MAFTYLTLGPITDSEKKGFNYLLENTKGTDGFVELYARPEDGSLPTKEHYIGWIQIHPDGKIEFGHPG